MSNQATLTELREGLRAELGQALDPNLAIETERRYAILLARMQYKLWLDADWEHLKVYRYQIVLAGSRYYDFPADLDPLRTSQAEYKFNGIYIPLDYGINADALTYRDSERNERSDPVVLWDFYHENATQKLQYEIWPVPTVNGNLYTPPPLIPSEETLIPDKDVDGDKFIRFEGIRNLNPLVEDGDKCELDKDLLIYSTAAKEAARQESSDAPALADLADQIFNRLTANYKKTQAFKLGTDINRVRKFRTLNSFRFKFAP